MPAAIDDDTRSAIVYYAALGYAQQAIADEVDVSRNTVRKYLRLTCQAVEESARPRETLSRVVLGEYDWARPSRHEVSFGDHPM